MNERANDFPAELQLELEMLRPILERNGVVQLHHGIDRNQRYRLRFREFDSDAGYTRHRSIPLGHNPVVVQAVAELIRRWQDEYQADEPQVRAQPSVESTTPPAKEETDPALELAQELCGGGWRRRKQIGEWYNKTQSDPVEMFRFNVTGAFPRIRKGGRPLKKRSW